MKHIRFFVIAISLLIFVNKTNAQSDHLEPIDGIFSIYNYEFDYYSKVRKVLFVGLTDSPEIRFLIMPSFTPENILDIEFDRKNNTYSLVYHICEKMIWDNKNWESTNVLEYRKEISKESVELIKSLFKEAISKTKYPDNEIIGLNGETYYVSKVDGEIYYFSNYEMGLKSGLVWSPSEGTKMDRLIKIGIEFIGLAKSDDNPVLLNDKLQKDILNLTNELK